MIKDFQYFHDQAIRTFKEVGDFDAYDLAICMEEAYNSGYEDCIERHKECGIDATDIL